MGGSRAAPRKAVIARHDLVLLFDVDNTLLDNDRLQNDLFTAQSSASSSTAKISRLDRAGPNVSQ
jgi:hypothetical protein